MAKTQLFFEVEGLRINIRAILARLELLFPERPAIWAGGVYDFVVRQEAAHEGWTVASDPASAAILFLFAPGDRVATGQILRAIDSMPALQGGCIVRESAQDDLKHPAVTWVFSRRFSPYHTIGHYLNFTARRFGFPRGLIQFLTALFRKLAITEVVGGRCFKVHLRNNEELYFGGGQPPSRHLRSSRFDLRDAAMSFLWIGHFGMAPGTVASLVTAAGFFVLSLLNPASLTASAAAVALLATLLCALFEPCAARRYFAKDARQVVLDEVAGQSLLIALLPAASSPWHFAAAFVLFRVFDILKPAVHWIESRNWRGTIVWDDLLAGLYGAACAYLLHLANIWPFAR